MRCQVLGELGDQMSFMCIVLGQIKCQTTDGTRMKIKDKINPSATKNLVQTNFKKKKKKGKYQSTRK